MNVRETLFHRMCTFNPQVDVYIFKLSNLVGFSLES